MSLMLAKLELTYLVHLVNYWESEMPDFRFINSRPFVKPLEPWQTHFLEFATQELLAGHKLQIAPSPRGKNLVNVSVTICAFDVMRDLTQSEFEKAVLLKPTITDEFLLLKLALFHK